MGIGVHGVEGGRRCRGQARRKSRGWQIELAEVAVGRDEHGGGQGTGERDRLAGALVVGAVEDLAALRELTEVVDEGLADVLVGGVIVLMVAFNARKDDFLRAESHKMPLVFASFCHKILVSDRERAISKRFYL